MCGDIFDKSSMQYFGAEDIQYDSEDFINWIKEHSDHLIYLIDARVEVELSIIELSKSLWEKFKIFVDNLICQDYWVNMYKVSSTKREDSYCVIKSHKSVLLNSVISSLNSYNTVGLIPWLNLAKESAGSYLNYCYEWQAIIFMLSNGECVEIMLKNNELFRYRITFLSESSMEQLKDPLQARQTVIKLASNIYSNIIQRKIYNNVGIYVYTHANLLDASSLQLGENGTLHIEDGMSHLNNFADLILFFLKRATSDTHSIQKLKYFSGPLLFRIKSLLQNFSNFSMIATASLLLLLGIFELGKDVIYKAYTPRSKAMEEYHKLLDPMYFANGDSLLFNKQDILDLLSQMAPQIRGYLKGIEYTDQIIKLKLEIHPKMGPRFQQEDFFEYLTKKGLSFTHSTPHEGYLLIEIKF